MAKTSKKTGREPIITTERPAWHYEESVTHRIMTYTMGYLSGDPCMALFAGEDNNPIIIPLDIIIHAIDIAAEKEQANA